MTDRSKSSLNITSNVRACFSDILSKGDVNERGLPSFGLLYYVQAEQTLLKLLVNK